MRLTTRALVGAAALAVAALAARPAAAIEYEAEVDVEDEEGLVNLLESEQITPETFDALREVLRQGIDLERASREDLYTLPNLTYAEVDAILAYRAEAGRVGDPQNLVTAGALTQDRLDTLAPFLRTSTPTLRKYATNGWLRSQNVILANDPGVPSSALSGRVVTVKHLTVGGAAVLVSNRLGEVVYDPLRDALTAQAPAARPALPKLFVRWDEGTWGVIAGSYRIGFGQRLTFDDTTRYTPNGFIPDDDILRGQTLSLACRESQGELDASPCAGEAGGDYTVPDYRWREGLLGIAGGVRSIPAGSGFVQLYGWASSSRRPIYQYEIYDRRTCGDPNQDDDPGCAAPQVYNTIDDPLADTSRWSFQTLPNMYRESLAGANVTWSQGATHLGVTGYGATVNWLVDGMDLDFQEYSRLPRGGMFGAVGADVGLRLPVADVFAEVTRSFDSTPEGGDVGGIVRATFSAKKQELELSARWYGQHFVNPYARSIAAPDEAGGQRARDEAGVRARYAGAFHKRFTLRTMADVWVNPSTDTPKTTVTARGDYLFTKQVGGGLWLTFVDKDLSESGGAECYSTTFDTDETGEPLACTGQRSQAALRLRYMPDKRLTLSAQYQHALLDDRAYPDSKRQDLAAWLQAVYRPIPSTRLRARTRYYDQDAEDNTSLERSWWSFLEVTHKVDKAWQVRSRFDLYVWLDERDSTDLRSPNPEMWLWFEVESRF